jgi:hypothetical protein
MSRYDATMSLWSQVFMSWPSSWVGFLSTAAGVGQGLVPSKCPQQHLAIIAPLKCMLKMAQLEPSSWRGGICITSTSLPECEEGVGVAIEPGGAGDDEGEGGNEDQGKRLDDVPVVEPGPITY